MDNKKQKPTFPFMTQFTNVEAVLICPPRHAHQIGRLDGKGNHRPCPSLSLSLPRHTPKFHLSLSSFSYNVNYVMELKIHQA